MISKLEDTALLRFNPTTLQDVRAEFDLDKPGRMDEAIDLLEDWLRKQEHFMKKDFSREYLERFILSAKGSVETVKRRLDKICTMRTTVPYLFDHFDANTDNALDAIVTLNLPQLTADHHRIYVIRFTGHNLSMEIVRRSLHYNVVMCEYFRRHDYCRGLHVIFDARDKELMSFVTNVNFLDLQNYVAIYTDGMGFRVKSINILSTSKMVDVLVTLFKKVMSEKLGKRIKVYKSIEALHEVLPRDLLPEEYGGREKPFPTLLETHIAEMSSKEHVEYFNAMRGACTDEARRSPDAYHPDSLGVPGSFRTLAVD